MSEQIRILLLEDDPADAEMIERVLERGQLPSALTRVASEEGFRNEIVKGTYDIVLADYQLPGFSGMGGLRIARELAPDLPFIFVTGSMGEDRAVQALRDGATDYVIKDRPERLPSAVRRALEECRETALRREMAEALARSEQRFQHALQATRDVIWERVNEHHIWISDAMTTEWGHSVPGHEVDSQWWLARIHPDDRERARRLLLEAIRDGSPRVSAEYRFQRGDGSYGHVFDRAVIIREEGREPRIIGAMQDITTRVESERINRELSWTNAIILENAGDGIVAVDRTGRLLFANPAATRALGWDGRIRKGDAVHAEIHECGMDDRCPILSTFLDPETRRGRENFRRGSATFPADATFSPIREEDNVTGCVIVFQDLEERQRLEKQLEQTRRVSTLGQIAATSAHEFNNVLMGILPFAEILQKHAAAPLEIRCASQILTSVARGRRITQDILRTTNMAEPVPHAVDLGAWLRQTHGEMAAVAGPRVEVRLNVPPHPLPATFDAGQLHQVLSNLVVNARDAMSGAGIITITGDADPGDASNVRMRVADTGSGIPPEVLPRIFEPLYTTKRTGTGLGLSVVQQIVERNRGRLSVESEVGRGTTFQILLPRADDPDETTREGHARRVIVVDDDEIVGDGIAAILDMHGMTVEVVRTGAAVESAVERLRPDIVVLDIKLPDMEGPEVYERLAARWPDLPVIFSSGDTSGARVARYLSRPNVRLLRKPYETASLVQLIAELTTPHGKS